MMREFNLLKKGTALAALTLMTGGSAFALPLLQLDIVNADGTYDAGSQTTVAAGQTFTLRALLNVPKFVVTPAHGPHPATDNSADRDPLLNDTYYISVALDPSSGTPSGSFLFNGATVNVPTDLTSGTPAGLGSHSIFATGYKEFAFAFNPSQSPTLASYNVADNTAGSDKDELYYVDFTVDTSLLDVNHALHFDLYEKDASGNVDKFAPFSHDAASLPGGGGDGGGGPTLPDAGTTLVMLGAGLLVLGSVRRNLLAP